MNTLPPGKYYIGDPCYVIDDKEWDDVLDATAYFENAGVSTFQGHQLWGHSTAYGDGTYLDQNGNEYGVDSGCIGAVPIGLIENPGGEDHGTMVIDAPEGLRVSYENGKFWFNSICIDTDPSDDEEDFDGGYDLDPEDDELT